MHYQNGAYLYRSIRTPQGPRHEYYGVGLLADLAADLDARDLARKQKAAQRRRQERRHERAIDADLDAAYKALRVHVTAVLLSAGWRAHRRQWRRRRYQINVELPTMADLPVKHPNELTRAEVADLLARCNVAKPKQADLIDLELFLRQSTNATMMAVSSAAQTDAIIEGTSNGPGIKLVMKAEVKRLTEELGIATCPPMERALIGHIVVCWLRMQIVEHTLTRITSQTHERREAEHLDRRLVAAQARYLRAMNLLMKMRALAIGNLQLNVAHGPQQVNNG